MNTPILRRRIDVAYVYDAKESGCNGDPDDDGRPRQDPYSHKLEWSDGALKRFWREAILAEWGDTPGHRVLIQHDYPRNRSQTEAAEALGIDLSGVAPADGDGAAKTKNGKNKLSQISKLEMLGWICKQFKDVRWHGGVFGTGYGLGELTGPIQFTPARTVHPVDLRQTTITNVCVATEKELLEGGKGMGTKYRVPYALFRGNIFYTPSFAEKTGFSVQDLREFVEILKDPFRSRQSAALGMVTLRKAWIFLHESARGNEQAGVLDDLVSVKPLTDVPEHLRDFEITFDDAGLDAKGIQVYTEETLDDLIEEVSARPGEPR